MTVGDPAPRQKVTVAEEAQARAYLTGVAAGFAILFEEWIGWGDGTATTAIDTEGARLIFTGDELHAFDAVIPCKNGHRRHRVGVSYPHDLEKARATTAECSAKAVDDPPTTSLRVVQRPSPLWLITQAADTPGNDRRQSAS